RGARGGRLLEVAVRDDAHEHAVARDGQPAVAALAEVLHGLHDGRVGRDGPGVRRHPLAYEHLPLLIVARCYHRRDGPPGTGVLPTAARAMIPAMGTIAVLGSTGSIGTQ